MLTRPVQCSAVQCIVSLNVQGNEIRFALIHYLNPNYLIAIIHHTKLRIEISLLLLQRLEKVLRLARRNFQSVGKIQVRGQRRMDQRNAGGKSSEDEE